MKEMAVLGAERPNDRSEEILLIREMYFFGDNFVSVEKRTKGFE